MVDKKFIYFTAFLAVFCLFQASNARQAIRIPRNLRPYNYTVRLRPDIYSSTTQFPFTGATVIDFDVVETTNAIILNQRGLTATNFFLALAPESNPANVPQLESVNTDNDAEIFNFTLNGNLEKDAKYRVVIFFRGNMAIGGGSGIYVDNYREGDKTTYLVATQFQRDATRTAFPSFDEPEFKANFNIELERRDGFSSLSNGDLIETIDLEDGWKRDRFERTPYMSCYLVAFVVSDFEHVEYRSEKGRRIRVWTRKSQIHKTNFTIEIAGKIQDWFEDWTGIEHQTSKTDHVAIPSKGGAMENWGLILYQENSLLYDEKEETISFKMRSASLIAHEVAHFWFGNLVTCEWWSDTWLNEGFAAFFQWEPLDDVLGWDKLLMQNLRAIANIKRQDESLTALPVNRPDVQLPAQAPSAFSRFTYSKGGALLRMFQQWLGKDVFQRAIRRYLKEYSFKSVVTQNLWDSIQEEVNEAGITNFNVSELFYPWVNQQGITRITVSKESNNLSLKQNRFPNFSENNFLWSVPITVTTQGENPGNDKVQKVLKNREESFTPDNLGEWYALNSKSAGYYRTLYNKADEDKLLESLESNVNAIDSVNRWVFMEDNIRRFSRDEIKEKDAFRFSKFLRNEVAAGPWAAFSDPMETTIRNIIDLSNDSALKNYMRYIADNIYSQVNFEPTADEPLLRTMTREVVSGYSCSFGNEDCVNKALELVHRYVDNENENPIVPDQRTIAYCTALANSDRDREIFTFLEKLLGQLPAGPHLQSVLLALDCPASESLVNEYLDRLLVNGTTYYSNLERFNRLSSFLRNERARFYIVPRLNQIWLGDYPEEYIHTTLLVLVSNSFEESRVNELKRILTERPENYATLVEILDNNLNWVNQNYQELREWLINNTPNSLKTNNSKYKVISNSFKNLFSQQEKMFEFSNE